MGYTFECLEGSVYHPGEEYTVIEDHILNAIWKKIEPGPDPSPEPKPTPTPSPSPQPEPRPIVPDTSQNESKAF